MSHTKIPRAVFHAFGIPLLALGACHHSIPDRTAAVGPGTLLVYSFDFEQAAEAGQIEPSELKDKQKLLQQFAEVIRKRADSTGEAKVQVTTQGDHQIVLDVPGTDADRLAQIKSLLQNQGLLEFGIIASDADGIDLAVERAKFEAWMDAHPQGAAQEFNRVPLSAGGPRGEIRWTRVRQEELNFGSYLETTRACVPLLVQDRLRPERTGAADSWDFYGGDLQYAGPMMDHAGLPAVAFELDESRKAAFADFTDAYTNRALAIVINQQVYTAPNINGRLPGAGIIMGGRDGFSLEERNALITVLRSGALRVLPRLESETPIPPQ